MKQTYCILILSIFPLFTYAQRKVSKIEVYSSWEKGLNEKVKVGGYKPHFNHVVVAFVDSLKASGVDTVGVYAAEYVGYVTVDSCMCDVNSWTAYVHWIKNGDVFHQKITMGCKFKPVLIGYSTLINYYISCRKNIDGERIVPVITYAKRNRKGDVIYGIEIVDHTIHYSIFCDIYGKSKFVTFDQNELEEKSNLFYYENINSTINSWRKMVENQMAEIEKKRVVKISPFCINTHFYCS